MTEDDTLSPEIHRGLLLLEQRRYADAETYFRTALGSDPDDPVAWYLLAVAVFSDPEERGAEALDAIEHAIGLDPEDAASWALRSRILASLEKGREALEAAERAVELDPSSEEGFRAQSVAHLQLQQWAEAESAARRALALDPQSTDAENLLTTALRLQGRLEEHSDRMAAMLARDPLDPFSHANAGWASLQRGDRDGAERHFLEALRLDPEMEHARSGLIEAFKARSPLYRAHLRYTFFLVRMSPRMRWGLILGLLLLVRTFRAILGGPIGFGVVALYMVFVLWTHLAAGIGSFLLLLDRRARLALRPREARSGLAVGGALILGVVLVVTGALIGWTGTWQAGVACIGAAFPLAYVFTNDSRGGRLLFGAFAGVLLVAGGSAIAGDVAPGAIPAGAVSGLASVGLLCWVATTWLASVPALNR